MEEQMADKGLMTFCPNFNQFQVYTGCPKKNYTFFWRAVAPLNFELGIKDWGVLESSGSQLFKTVPTFDF